MADEEDEPFGSDHLRGWRYENRLTREMAAKVLGVKLRTIEGWENGRGAKSAAWGLIEKCIEYWDWQQEARSTDPVEMWWGLTAEEQEIQNDQLSRTREQFELRERSRNWVNHITKEQRAERRAAKKAGLPYSTRLKVHRE